MKRKGMFVGVAGTFALMLGVACSSGLAQTT